MSQWEKNHLLILSKVAFLIPLIGQYKHFFKSSIFWPYHNLRSKKGFWCLAYHVTLNSLLSPNTLIPLNDSLHALVLGDSYLCPRRNSVLGHQHEWFWLGLTWFAWQYYRRMIHNLIGFQNCYDFLHNLHKWTSDN